MGADLTPERPWPACVRRGRQGHIRLPSRRWSGRTWRPRSLRVRSIPLLVSTTPRLSLRSTGQGRGGSVATVVRGWDCRLLRRLQEHELLLRRGLERRAHRWPRGERALPAVIPAQSVQCRGQPRRGSNPHFGPRGNSIRAPRSTGPGALMGGELEQRLGGVSEPCCARIVSRLDQPGLNTAIAIVTATARMIAASRDHSTRPSLLARRRARDADREPSTSSPGGPARRERSSVGAAGISRSPCSR